MIHVDRNRESNNRYSIVKSGLFFLLVIGEVFFFLATLNVIIIAVIILFIFLN